MVNHELSEEYIQLIEQTYNKEYLENEENKIKEVHIRLNSRYAAYIELIDEIIKAKDIIKLNGFVNLVNTRLSKELSYIPEEILYILQFLEIYTEEINENKSDLIYSVDDFEDFVKVMINIRFMVWRIEYLGGSFDELESYIQQRKLSMCLLYKAVLFACIEEKKTIDILQKIAESNGELFRYLQTKVKD